MTSLLTPSPLLALFLLCILTIMAYCQGAGVWLKRLRHILILLSIWSWVCCTPVAANWVMVQLEGQAPELDALVAPIQPLRPGSVIVVLGSAEMFSSAGAPAPRLDEHGWERLYAGVQLWRQTGGQLVFTGGPGSTADTSIAGKMGGMAIQWGVPQQAILMATSSLTTYEDLIRAQTMVPRGAGPIWLVTSAMHMPRAMAVARKLGLPAQAYPVDYRQIDEVTWAAWLPNPAALARMMQVVHEIIGLWYYRYQGWAE
jgi:uncharacterized SAM-binding protein YcdF (DUF218 family)